MQPSPTVDCHPSAYTYFRRTYYIRESRAPQLRAPSVFGIRMLALPMTAIESVRNPLRRQDLSDV
jgi:hypothetical protein